MTDFLLVLWVSALIEMRRIGWMFGLGERWTAGEKLKLLFAGYNGTRNTGSDVRVQEMLRQIRHVLGAQNVDFSEESDTLTVLHYGQVPHPSGVHHSKRVNK